MRDKRQNRITFEPFLFGLAIAGVIYKIYQVFALKEVRYDWILAAIVFIFLVVCGLWAINTRRSRSLSNIDTGVTTGGVKDSEIIGAEASRRDMVRAQVNTGDVTKSSVVGYREKDL